MAQMLLLLDNRYDRDEKADNTIYSMLAPPHGLVISINRNTLPLGVLLSAESAQALRPGVAPECR